MKTSGKYKFAKQKTFLVTYCLLLATVAAALPLVIQAEPSTTDNYRLDPNVSNSFGGLTDSDSYQLLDSGGEAAVGLGDSPSYKLSQGYVSQLEQAIELNVLPDGLVGYWPLNTGTGIQAYDDTASNNRGVLTNGPTWVNGKVGSGALQFDGSDDYIDINSDLSSVSGGSNKTVSAWVDNSSGSGTRRIITLYETDTTSAFSIFRLSSTGTWMGGYINTSGNWTFIDSEVSTSSGWTHVALTQNGSEIKIYVDGDLKNTANDGGSATLSNPHDATIGAYYSGTYGEFFNGSIDEAKVYSRALSEDEVTDEYTATNAGLANALTLPKLDSTSSQTVAADAIVRTDAGGYHLAIEQDGDLRTEDGETIPPINGSISAPNLWNEGDTTGFGFTVIDAVQRDGKWGTDPDFEYAAVPGSSTTFHARDGLSGGTKEITSLQFRTGIDTTQAGGIYRNRLGFTATLKP